MSFNVVEVEQKVKTVLAKDNTDVEACRNIYLEEIMDWSDYFTESNISMATEEGQRLVRSLIDLWYSFVKFEANLGYFKKAADLFEKALVDMVVGLTAEIHRLYADYFLSRSKLGLASKGYQRGLTNPKLSTVESFKLWVYYADFIKETKNFEAESMQTLRQLLFDQLPEAERTRLAAAPPDAEVEAIRHTLITRPKEGTSISTSSGTTSVSSAPTRGTQQDVAESKESESLQQKVPARQPLPAATKSEPTSTTANPLLSSVMIDDMEANPAGGLNPEQLVRLFRRRPPLLFVAPTKEPMKAGMKGLIADEVLSLEKFLGTNLSYNNGANASGDKLEYVLDVLQALWYGQALKERHFDEWCIELRNQHVREGAQLEKKLQAQNMPDMAVKLEQNKFQSKCAVQRELLQAVINKVLYTLLLEQERILVALQFPRFSKTFLPRIENMSLFTTAPNASSLFDDLTTREIVSQRKFVCALLSLRLVGGRKVVRCRARMPMPVAVKQEVVNGDADSSSNNGDSGEVGTTGDGTNAAVPDMLAFLNSIEVPVGDSVQTEESVETPGSGRKKRRRTVSSTSPDNSGVDRVVLARRDSYGEDEGHKVRVVNSAVDDTDGSTVPQLISSSYDQVVPLEDNSGNSGSDGDEMQTNEEEEQVEARFSDVEEEEDNN